MTDDERNKRSIQWALVAAFLCSVCIVLLVSYFCPQKPEIEWIPLAKNELEAIQRGKSAELQSSPTTRPADRWAGFKQMQQLLPGMQLDARRDAIDDILIKHGEAADKKLRQTRYVFYSIGLAAGLGAFASLAAIIRLPSLK